MPVCFMQVVVLELAYKIGSAYGEYSYYSTNVPPLHYSKSVNLRFLLRDTRSGTRNENLKLLQQRK